LTYIFISSRFGQRPGNALTAGNVEMSVSGIDFHWGSLAHQTTSCIGRRRIFG